MKKRFLAITDSHCGHIGGLTPPGFRVPPLVCTQLGQDWESVEATAWNWFKAKMKGKKYDGCFFAGDGIEGKGRKNGGRELITSDRKIQAAGFAEVLRSVPTERFAAVYGTPYHTGDDENFEGDVRAVMEAEGRQFTIRDVLDIEVEDKLIRMRHHLAGTQTPVGGDIAMRKRRVEDLVWEAENGIRKADLYLFGHRHQFSSLSGAGWQVVSLPALQTFTEFGARRCGGAVHFGIVEIDYENGRFTIRESILKLVEMSLNKPVRW